MWKSENCTDDWKEKNLKEIQERLNGWQLESFLESYENKVNKGISLYKEKSEK